MVTILDTEFKKEELKRILKFISTELVDNDDIEKGKVRSALIKLHGALKMGINMPENDSYPLGTISFHTIKEYAEAADINLSNNQCDEIARDLSSSWESDWDFDTAVEDYISDYAREHNIKEESN